MTSEELLSLLQLYGTNQSLAAMVETYETSPGYIRNLIRLVDRSELGDEINQNVRLLAVIVLKNSVLKLMKRASSSDHSLEHISTDIEFLKSWILSYDIETNSKINALLSLITLSIARAHWPQRWPKLVPSLVKNLETSQPLSISLAFKTSLVVNIIEELSTKLNCCYFNALVTELCLTLFPAVVKMWLLRTKEVKDIIISSSGVYQPLSALVEMQRNPEIELLFHHACLCSKLFKIVVEAAYPFIVNKCTCFPKVWSSYMSTISSLVAWLRQSRAKFVELLNVSKESDGDLCCIHGGNLPALDWIYCDEDVDCINSDDVIDLSFDQSLLVGMYGGLYSVYHLIQRLLKTMYCLPIILQRKFPEKTSAMMLPSVDFYCNQLLEEYGEGQEPSLITGLDPTVRCPLPMKMVTRGSCVYLASILLRVIQHRTPSIRCDLQQLRGEETTTTIAGTVDNNMYEEVFRYFSSEKIHTLLRIILQFVLVWEPQELALWIAEPTQFFLQECGDKPDCEGTIRTAGQQLFLSLQQSFPTVVNGFLLDHLFNLQEQQSVSCEEAPDRVVLYWDAVYQCAQLGIGALVENEGRPFDCTDWLQRVLGPILMNLGKYPLAGILHGRHQKVLTVRLLRLIGSWIDYFPSTNDCDDSLENVYEHIVDFLVCMLLPSNQYNLVVSLFTVKTLEQAILAKNADLTIVMKNSLTLVESLSWMIHQIDDVDTQKWILSVMEEIFRSLQAPSIVLERIDQQEILLALLDCVLEVWQTRSSEVVLCSSILSALKEMVKIKLRCDQHYPYFWSRITSLLKPIAEGCKREEYRDDALSYGLTVLQQFPPYADLIERDKRSILDTFMGNVENLYHSLPDLSINTIRNLLHVIITHLEYFGKELFGCVIFSQFCRAMVWRCLALESGLSAQCEGMQFLLIVSMLCSDEVRDWFVGEHGLMVHIVKNCLSYAPCSKLSSYAGTCSPQSDEYLLTVLHVLAWWLLNSSFVVRESLSIIKDDILGVLKSHGSDINSCNLTEVVLLEEMFIVFMVSYERLLQSVVSLSTSPAAAMWYHRLWLAAMWKTVFLSDVKFIGRELVWFVRLMRLAKFLLNVFVSVCEYFPTSTHLIYDDAARDLLETRSVLQLFGQESVKSTSHSSINVQIFHQIYKDNCFVMTDGVGEVVDSESLLYELNFVIETAAKAEAAWHPLQPLNCQQEVYSILVPFMFSWRLDCLFIETKVIDILLVNERESL